MPAEEKERPTYLIKAFYDTLYLVNLFPLLESDFEVEIGSEAWKKAIANYQNYGVKQEIVIPSFSLINSMFNPKEIIQANQTANHEVEEQKVPIIYDDQSDHEDLSVNHLNLDLLKTKQDILNKSTLDTLFKLVTTVHPHDDSYHSDL